MHVEDEDHRRLHVHSKKLPLLLEAGLSKPAIYNTLADQENDVEISLRTAYLAACRMCESYS